MILTVTLNSCVHKYLNYEDTHPHLPVVRPVRSRTSSGGKGFNAARVVGILGGDALALGFAGGHIGRLLRDCLVEEGVRAELIDVAAPTRLSVCLYDRLSGRFRELLEEGQDPGLDEVAGLRDAFRRRLEGAAVVTLNGSSPGPNLHPLFAEFCREARAAGKTVILDSYGPPAAQACTVPPHWIRCNREELTSTYGWTLNAELHRVVREAHGRGLEGVLVSDGAQGAHCITPEEHLLASPPAVQEVNPVGSGDAMTAAFALALERGASLVAALRLGVAAGCANAEQLGVCDFERARCEELQGKVSISSVKAV